MKKLLISLTTAAFVFITTSSQATLILYEPFDYPVGDRLGGSVTASATNVVGKIAPNGQQWIVRSPANQTNYSLARDVAITNGSLSYPGLVPSKGNAVRYGSGISNNPTLYTDAIAIPGGPYLSGSLYYSMIVHLHSAIPSGGARTCYAAFSEDTANPVTDAGVGVITSSGTANTALPAGAWIRNSGTTQYQLGGGKQNGDGLGTSASWPSWQAAGALPNQQGNTAGATQDWATIDSNPAQPYFIVMKYTYNSGSSSDDTVSMWVNPVAATLGYDGGEWLAGLAGGSYYSATNAYTTANIDANYFGIQSFLLLGNAQASASFTKTIDVTLDELRIGTTWADVTPLPLPQIISIAGAGTTSVTVTWTNVQFGTNYVLQYNTNVVTATWSNLAPVAAAGTTTSQTDNPPAGAAARFYRVLKP